MVRSAIALGSNLSPRQKHLLDAIALMEQLKESHIIARSRIYETPPVGGPEQGKFLNAAVELETALSVDVLLKNLLSIEQSMGRIRNVRNGPRIIDLDIIFYDDLCNDSPHLTVPHPRFSNRGFVLLPMNDIMPLYIDPRSGKTISELLVDWRREGDDDYFTLGPL
ncbi:MAG: 2-amino-4-hydroxy-6-hydroxymethyldihydropteridine diphosphokinase [Planctomycetota bacterium]